MTKPKTLGKLALATVFAAALVGCGPSSNTRTSTQNSVIVDTGMHVVNEYDRNLDRYTDFMTNQLCEGKTGSASDLTCRNFEDLTGGARMYVEDMKTLLTAQDLQAVRPGARETNSGNISVNPVSGVFNEYGRYYERYVDFKTETLCVSKTSYASALTCTGFSNLTQAQKDYVDGAKRTMDKASQPKPNS